MITKIKNSREIVISFDRLTKLNVLSGNFVQKKLSSVLELDFKLVLLDLHGIKFIDSAVFRILLEFERMIKIRGKKLALMNVTADVDELLHLLNIEHVLVYKKAA